MASFLYLFTIGAIKLSCFDGLNKKTYQIHLSRLCALSSHKYFLHMTWPLRKKNTYSFRDEREWLLRCREREQESRISSPRVGNIKKWKKTFPTSGTARKWDAITPGNGNRNGENKKEWYDYTKKYLEIFGVRLSFVPKYSETPPPPF